MSTRRARAVVAATILPLVALVASCGGDDEEPVGTSTTTTTTEAPAGDERDGGDTGVDEAWARNAVEHRDRVGEQVEVDCPPGGTLRTVWGTNTYTDDSSICNGVETQDFGPYEASFTFPEAEELEVTEAIGWDRAATFYANRDETEFSVQCEPDGTIGTVWGTKEYTADSSICTAALHAGLVTLEDGGEVSFELVDGRDEYRASTANGVTSLEYGTYDRSFRFTD